ncbi:hypothetical protein CHS0354_023713 [Potamilus streckersoni]|uniref:DNA ligase (NAD(+)) n=1 Tax=Potamilus streckersoni TaxID=2493646 RepID=A0AAE0VLD1_9BIVA|nr:hypothetical protein CHS0354_023713 [Potamilus streckersoni]
MTRGNGVYGEDITKNIHEIKSIPMEIKSTKNPLIKELANSSFEVRGEVYIKLSDFNAINEIRRLKGEIEFQNPRNAAGGSLKLLDPLEVSSRKLSALFYYIDSHSPLLEKIESQYLRIQLLREIGFFINSNVYYSESLNEIYEKISNWYEVRRELDFEIDGAVIKVDNVNYWNILGETAKYPKWAIAYKFTSFKEKSQIVNVEFQVGRTGIITPVAELTPVKISGSIVSRASLYNIEEIKRLNIAIGDKVLVEKAGDVIPKILKLESPADSNLRKEIILPEFCPSCGTKLKVRKSVIGLFCENTMNCKQRIKAEILYFCSKEAMNIQFVGSSLISDLYDNGLISDIGDLYYLNENQLKHLNKIKDKSSNRILSSIRTSKGNSPVQILIGLGIEHVGEQIARKLLAKFESIKNLMNASIEDVLAVPNIGAVIAESVHNFFQQPHKKSVIHKLENVGFDFSKKDEPELINNSLNGKIFVFTGTLSSLKREDAKMKVKMLGGTTSDTISKETSYLVATETNSAKYKKAVAIGTKILSETDFLTMEKIIDSLKNIFKLYGFEPLETPHVEYAKVLMNEEIDDVQKQLYRFLDNGKRDVVLRYDHTVPLARFVVQNKSTLKFPYKRYSIGNVFRAESPQVGRYREFTQFDFDCIGSDSLFADIEILQMVSHSVTSIGKQKFKIRLNHRKIIKGLVKFLNVTEQESVVYRAIDKLNKIGVEGVSKILFAECHFTQNQIDTLLEFILPGTHFNPVDYHKSFLNSKIYNLEMQEGFSELQIIMDILKKFEAPEANYAPDFSIVRGLSYYSGVIYETVLCDNEELGSIASGGRYDNLTKKFSKDNLTGVGASIGIDRLLVHLEKNSTSSVSSNQIRVYIANLDNSAITGSFHLASMLRKENFVVDVSSQIKKISKHFEYADAKLYDYLIGYGEKELLNDKFTVSNLKTGVKTELHAFDALKVFLLASKKDKLN